MRCGASPAIWRPSKVIDPADGTSVPESMLKIVLLPDPFGPIMPTISPRSTLNDTLLTAVTPPKRFESPLTVSTSDTPLVYCSRDEGALPLPRNRGLPRLRIVNRRESGKPRLAGGGGRGGGVRAFMSAIG